MVELLYRVSGDGMLFLLLLTQHRFIKVVAYRGNNINKCYAEIEVDEPRAYASTPKRYVENYAYTHIGSQ